MHERNYQAGNEEILVDSCFHASLLFYVVVDIGETRIYALFGFLFVDLKLISRFISLSARHT